ncbi:MAG: hypothetical protein L6R36_003992 [Xanthoria steineri]|nr:MAG: hypothetical protein L6R36_003992 [Xanthoria steineri]
MGHNQSTPAKNGLQQVSGDVTSSQKKNMASSETSTVSSSSAGIVLSSPISTASSSGASIMSSPATRPSTQVATPMPKKRGRPPKTPKKTSTAMVASSAPSTMSSLQTGATSSAVTLPATDEVKPPARKRGRPPKLNKGPSPDVILASNANQALPKKRGRPPKKRNELPSNAATKTAKRQKTRFKDRDWPTRPTSAEVAHLELASYRIDKDDGQLFWLLPDGAEPEYLPHPGRGKKYQWGFEYSSLPEDYEGDDSDAGLQLWLNAKYQNSTGYEQGTYPLGDEEDAEGESDEFDAARGLIAMDTCDPVPMSSASDPHDGSPAPNNLAPAQTAPELTNTQATANKSRDAQPLREMQTQQPVAGANGRAATATNGQAGEAPNQPKTKRDLEQLRQRVGPTRWWCHNAEGVWGYFEQKRPPPKNWAEIGYPGFQVGDG